MKYYTRRIIVSVANTQTTKTVTGINGNISIPNLVYGQKLINYENTVFDVMLDGRFVHTFRYQYCPLFPIDEQELEKFVTDRLPTLKGKDFKIVF